MDKLQRCAKAFEQLLDKKYRIVIGRKGKSVELELIFDAADFHHLLGLHKLKDIEVFSGKRAKVFGDILAGQISFSAMEKSQYFSQIENRVEPFSALETLLDDNRLIFRYNKKINSFSLITAEYLLSTPYQATDVYIFLDRKGEGEQFFCRSFFPKESRDYTAGQAAYTLLYKEKITVSTGQKEFQYDRLSPLPKKQ